MRATPDLGAWPEVNLGLPPGNARNPGLVAVGHSAPARGWANFAIAWGHSRYQLLAGLMAGLCGHLPD